MKLTFTLPGWVFKFLHIVYAKHEYNLNRKRYNYEAKQTKLWTQWLFWRIKQKDF